MSWMSYNTPVKNTADDNITCYKVFHKTDITWRVEKTSDLTFEPKIKEIKSLYKQYKYIPYNINPKIDIIYKWSDIENIWYIEEGYNSYISLEEAKKYISYAILTPIVRQGFICALFPLGYKYILGIIPLSLHLIF